MKFYRLKSVFPGISIAQPFIGYVCQLRKHEHNGREMILLTMTTEEGRKQWGRAWFYWSDLEEVSDEANG